MTRVHRLLGLLIAVFAFLAAPAAAVNFPPRPQGPIYDEANLLPAAEEAQLDQRLRDFDAKTGDAVIVATVNSLQGDDIDDYAANLYKTWGIGGAKEDNGVLLLVAPSEHKVRIEVGYGLTPYITDILSGRIVRDDMTPKFKQGDMAGGIEAGVNVILDQLSKSPEDAKAVAEAAAAAEKNTPRRGGGGFPIGGIVWLIFILFFVILPASRRRGGRRYGGGVGSTVGNILLWSALGSMSGGRNSGGGSGGFGGGGFGGGGGGGFGGFGGGMSGGGGASGGW